jgi:mono/diheme cytochrome c family protein
VLFRSDIYCGICHGNLGNGQGNLVKREKFLGVPSYDDVGRAITEGSIYHTIYYGKNAMGSYANQLKEEERWQVVAYVLKLKADLLK